MAENLTPLFRQYWEIKRQYPDVLLLFRLGDFYETFYEDAAVAAQALEITLTSRPGAGGERVPMAGIPAHAVERYLARLIAAGHRVALCDQVEDPRFAKGLVRRQVTRVVTPGTVLEESLLEAKANHYLVAVIPGGEELDTCPWGVAVADVSTGEFAVTEIHGEAPGARLLEELERLAPRELLLPERAAGAEWLTQARPWVVTPVAAAAPFRRRSARQTLLDHFQTQSLRGFGCEELPLAIEAAAAILDYLRLRQVDAARHLRSLATYSLDAFMGLDATARRNLEVTQSLSDGSRARSLLGLVDTTLTPMGGRLLRRWLERPLLDPAAIRARLDAVEELVGDALFRGDVRERLRECADLERLASRAGTGTATPRDLGALRRSLALLPTLRTLAATRQGPLLAAIAARLDPLDDLRDLLERALVDDPPALLRDGGILRPGYDPTLDDLRRAVAEGKEWIANLEARERERTGIKSLKVGYNAVFGYYIEVTRPNVPLVPADYHRKQTTANAERYITPELKEREALVIGAEERIVERESRLFQELRETVGRAAPRILAVAAAIAELDALAAFAETAVRLGFSRPVVDDGPVIDIRNGRHPVVERFGSEPFVPNDCFLDGEEHRLLIITGPNMAGKSTYLRQTALIVLLAQAGCFVPADAARIGVVDRIFTRVGAHDDLASGQSTFMVEMTETANILHHATPRSLVILDEIGRGTSTYDGLSIAWAVAEHLQRIECKTLFATHYHHLNDLAERLPGVKNYRVAVKEEGHHIVWLRKIVPGGTDRSYGIQVARLAGLPEEVIERAREVLAELEAQSRNGRSPARTVRIEERKQRLQLTLFEGEEHPVLAELRALDLTTMSPIEALTTLYRLQRQLGK